VTYASHTLTELARYWVSHGGVNLGIVGDTRHVALGRSYHLGRSSLTADAYSRTTHRDRAGLTEAASAIDLGKLGGSFPALRKFSLWLVKRCQSNAPGTQDIREVIYSPDGHVVLRWDRERGLASEPRPGEADVSHLGHTHVSWYRDSEKRAKVGAFAPYFAPVQEAPVATGNRLTDAIVTRAGYLANELAAGDNDGALAQIAKINEFTGRILVSIVGSNVDVTDPDEPLSSNPAVATHQLLAATGHPTTLDENGSTVSTGNLQADVIKDGTPEQIRELALLGLFGQPGQHPVDYSLFEQYYVNDGQGNYAPKDPSKSAWATYLASKA